VPREPEEIFATQLRRLHDEHVGRLLDASSNAHNVFDPMSMRSLGRSVALYRQLAEGELRDYTKRIQAEVLRTLEIEPLEQLEGAVLSRLHAVKLELKTDLYPNRLKLLFEGFERQSSRMGVKLPPSGPSHDVALHTAATANHISTFLGHLRDEADLLLARRRHRHAAGSPASEKPVEQINQLVKLEPNLFGIGININYLIRRWLKRTKK
jgi:hypothetical protein